MKTIFDKTTREELISRINTLNENSKAQWGKMTVYQMVKHCSRWEEMALGKRVYKQVLIGRLFGKMALKDFLKDKPIRHNSPTMPDLRITDNGDVELEKIKWLNILEEYAHSSIPGIMHPFFGKMTKEQVGWMAYKHIDHHLRQFNA